MSGELESNLSYGARRGNALVLDETLGEGGGGCRAARGVVHGAAGRVLARRRCERSCRASSRYSPSWMRTVRHSKRAALVEQLRTLWLLMMNYRAQVAAQSGDKSELTGRIRDLCRSIERRASVMEETERLLR